MLMDATRIEQDIQRVLEVRRAKLDAFGFHQPEALDRMDERLTNALLAKRSEFTDEQLIAYALRRQQEVNAQATPEHVS